MNGEDLLINPTLILSETATRPTTGQIYGIHTATEGFLEAYIRHGESSELRYLASNDAQHAAVLDVMNRSAKKPTLKRVISAHDVGASAMYYSLPNANHVWMRQYHGTAAYSLCGLNHTLSGNSVYEHLRDLFLSPAQPWDAIICTSQASKKVIEKFFDGWSDYLGERTGARVPQRWTLPVIPLGIHARDFEADDSAKTAGRALRSRLNISDDALVVLFLGRLNFTSKAHPYPMFLALERACEQLKRDIHLIQAGWFPSDVIEKVTMELASQIAPRLRVHNVGTVAGPDRAAVFAAADVFMSLTDNIQETFGLSVVEAMASSCPVIVSDWDGYRDTVIHGETGFLVPSAMPPAGYGSDIAQLHGLSGRPYNRYLADVGQATAIDIRKTVEYVVRLGSDPQLRIAMGHAGVQRVRTLYDWAKIIPAYQALWAELDAKRSRATVSAPTGMPQHQDPFLLFDSFASHCIDENCWIRLAPDAEKVASVALASPTLRSPSDLLIPDDVFRGMMADTARRGTQRIGALLDAASASRHRAMRCIMWGIKVGVFEPVDVW